MALSAYDILVLMILALGSAWLALAVLAHLDTPDPTPVNPLDYLDLTDLVDGHQVLDHRARVADYDVLRAVADMTDTLMWRVDADGQVDWHNRAYDRMLARLGHPAGQPGGPVDLFAGQTGESDIGTICRRVSAQVPSGDTLWFDLRARREGSAQILTATPVTATVEADMAMRGFVQTLAATFAHLRVGLAMFDGNRQLTLFNPALLDLTGLDAGWLAARPRMDAFFDRLREDRILPEPRNYADWRARLERLDRDAPGDDTVQDLWSLPDGRTFRVIGRPHPNNGLALLIEDISDDLDATRRLHGDLQTAERTIARLRVPVAVLTQSCGIVRANPAFDAIRALMPADIPALTRTETRAIQLADGRRAEMDIEKLDQDMWLVQVHADQIGDDRLRAAG